MVYSQQQCLDCQNFRCSRLCRTIKHTLGNSSGKKLESAYSSLSSLLYDDTLQLKSIDKKNIVVWPNLPLWPNAQFGQSSTEYIHYVWSVHWNTRLMNRLDYVEWTDQQINILVYYGLVFFCSDKPKQSISWKFKLHKCSKSIKIYLNYWQHTCTYICIPT